MLHYFIFLFFNDALAVVALFNVALSDAVFLHVALFYVALC